MKKIGFEDSLHRLTMQLPKGVFLNTAKDGQCNTMTIGWAMCGIIWSRPVITVAVRYSRHTYKLIEGADEFALSVPKPGTMLEELKFAGTESGRNYDKFAELNLVKLFADSSNVPLIKGCGLHYTCKTVYQQSMEPSNIKSDSVDRFYNSHDYHVLYYGEVTGVYEE